MKEVDAYRRTPVDDIEPIVEPDHEEMGALIKDVVGWIIAPESYAERGLLAMVVLNALDGLDITVSADEYAQKHFPAEHKAFRDKFGRPSIWLNDGWKYVARLVGWMVSGSNTHAGRGIWAMVAGSYVGILENQGATLEQMGGDCFTRAYIGKASVSFRDTFHIQSPHSKDDDHRTSLKSAKRLKPRQYHVNAITKLAHGLN